MQLQFPIPSVVLSPGLAQTITTIMAFSLCEKKRRKQHSPSLQVMSPMPSINVVIEGKYFIF